MSWENILKSPLSIMRRWINSENPPDLFYFEQMKDSTKKEFIEVFTSLLDAMQMKQGSDGLGGLRVEETYRTENIQGKVNLYTWTHKEEIKGSFKFQIAPASAGFDKYGRYTNYYFYFNKNLSETDTAPMYMTTQEFKELMEILNIKG